MRLSQTAIAKRSAKGAMTDFFRRAHQQRVSKNEMCQQFGVSAGETYQKDFLKAAVFNYSTKGRKSCSFRRATWT